MAATAELDVAEILRQRSVRKRGVLYPHGIGKAILDSVSTVAPELDPTGMSATVVISTPDEDRSEDIVVPEGIRLENYAKNPVVFYDHAMDLTLPIAKSEHPDGSLAIEIRNNQVYGTSYFSQSSGEAHQIFGLIEERIIRAASVDIIPLMAKARSPGSGCRPGLLLQECELLEWSWVGIPDNPEAVRKVLDRGRIAGSPLYEPIKKSLLSLAPRAPVWSPGWNPIPKTATGKGAPMPAGSIRKDAPDKDQETIDGNQVQSPDAMDDDDPDYSDLDYDQQPYGVKVSHDVHGSLSDAAKSIKSALGPLENPELKEHLKGLSDALDGHVSDLESCYGKCYPDGPEMKSQETDNEVGGDETGFLKHLRGDRVGVLQLKGLAAQLKRLPEQLRARGSKAQDLETFKKAVALELRKLRETADGLLRVAKRASLPVKKSAQPAAAAADDAVDPKLLEMAEKLEKKFEQVLDRVGAQIPAGKP